MLSKSEVLALRRLVLERSQAAHADNLTGTVSMHPETIAELSASPWATGLDVVRELDTMPDDPEILPMVGPPEIYCSPRSRGAVVRLYLLDVVADASMPKGDVRVDVLSEN